MGYLFRLCLALATLTISLSATAHQGRNPGDKSAAVSENEVTVTGLRNQTWSEWVCGESSNFIVYGRKEEEVRKVATKLERFRLLLRLLTGTPEAEKTRPLSVYLVSGTSEIERFRRQARIPGLIYTGYYSAAPTGTLLAADMRWDDRYSKVPAYHETWLYTEYVRHFLQQHARAEYLPSWYVDGLSLYLASTRFDGDRIEYGKAHPNIVHNLETISWKPLRDIVSGKVRSGQIYTAEAMLLVHYLLSNPAHGTAFKEYLAAVRSGVDPVAAFETAFSTNINGMQKRLWTYRTKATYTRVNGASFSAPSISISTLPQSADALLLDQAAMEIGIPEPERQQAVLRRAKEIAAKFSDDYAWRVLVQSQILYGEPESADALLKELLAKRPEDPALQYLKGLQHLMSGRKNPDRTDLEFHQAKRWFAAAYRNDPAYYPALYAWAETLSVEPGFVSQNTINVLVKAALLAPEASQIRMAAALMMMADGQFQSAQDLLSLLVASPRDPATEQLPFLLADARTRRQPDLNRLLLSFRYTATWKDLNCC